MREAVLAAAEMILAEAGVARLSTKEIARRAEVAESSIFYHFGDRLGLLQAVVRAHLPLYKDAASGVQRQAGHGTPRDNVIALLDALEAFFLRIMPILAAVQADGELRALFAARSGELAIGPQRAIETVVDYLVSERELGRVRGDLNAHAVAFALVGVAHQRAMQRHLTGTDLGLPTVPEIVDTFVPVFTADAGAPASS